MMPRNGGGGQVNRKKIVVVTGKDTDNRFYVMGPNRMSYVVAGRSGYVQESNLKLRAAPVFNLTESRFDCDHSTQGILNFNEINYYVEGTTYSEKRSGEREELTKRINPATNKIEFTC